MNDNKIYYEKNMIIDKKNINNINYKLKEELKDNSYLYYEKIKTTSFSDLFAKKSKSSIIPSNGTTTQNIPTSLTPQSSTGRTFDATRRWSPVSSAGLVFEWNRGVLGVSENGEVRKESLDGTSNHHADATVRIVRSLGKNIVDTDLPFEAAVKGAEEGVLIFQSEGDNGLVYFPSTISNEQYEELSKILTPRSRFNFSYTHADEIFEEQSMMSVLNFASSIVTLEEDYARA